MTKRKKAEESILSFAKDADPSGRTFDIYKTLFSKLDDNGFDEFMHKLKDYGYIPVFVMVANGPKLDSDGLLALGDRMGHDFWDHIVIDDPDIGEPYTTPKKYFNVYKIIRRQCQTQEQGISVSENYNIIDSLTGQTVGSSKGAGYSYPEALLTISNGNFDLLKEFYKFRGGDVNAARFLLRDATQNGIVYMNQYDDKTVSKITKFMEVMFKGIHIDSNYVV